VVFRHRCQARKEIRFRRIGRNEISTIRVCQELVAAERNNHSARARRYAQKNLSDEGQHNWSYWKVAEGRTPSPIGPLVASAVSQGYVKAEMALRLRTAALLPHPDTSGKNAPGV